MNALCLQHWHLRLKCRLVIDDNFQLLADSTLTDFQDVSNWKSKYPMNQSFYWFQNEIAFPWCGSCEWVVEHGWKKIHYRYFPINNLTLIYQSTTRTGAFSWGSVETTHSQRSNQDYLRSGLVSGMHAPPCPVGGGEKVYPAKRRLCPAPWKLPKPAGQSWFQSIEIRSTGNFKEGSNFVQ